MKTNRSNRTSADRISPAHRPPVRECRTADVSEALVPRRPRVRRCYRPPCPESGPGIGSGRSLRRLCTGCSAQPAHPPRRPNLMSCHDSTLPLGSRGASCAHQITGPDHCRDDDGPPGGPAPPGPCAGSLAGVPAPPPGTPGTPGESAIAVGVPAPVRPRSTRAGRHRPRSSRPLR